VLSTIYPLAASAARGTTEYDSHYLDIFRTRN
jgi:hypothetical protein